MVIKYFRGNAFLPTLLFGHFFYLSFLTQKQFSECKSYTDESLDWKKEKMTLPTGSGGNSLKSLKVHLMPCKIPPVTKFMSFNPGSARMICVYLVVSFDWEKSRCFLFIKSDPVTKVSFCASWEKEQMLVYWKNLFVSNAAGERSSTKGQARKIFLWNAIREL